MARRYQSLHFAQGDAAEDSLDVIATSGPELELESIKSELPDEIEEHAFVSNVPPWAAADSSIANREGYVLSWNMNLSYVGLTRIIEDEEINHGTQEHTR